jgi:hypothetical protein
MVDVRDEWRYYAIFRSQLCLRHLEIARYCTRINRTTKQDHKHPPQTSIAEMLCDRFHGAVKGHFNVNCTNMVLDVHTEASIMVQQIQCGAALLHYGAHDNAFLGCFKSWHRFRFTEIQ